MRLVRHGSAAGRVGEPLACFRAIAGIPVIGRSIPRRHGKHARRLPGEPVSKSRAARVQPGPSLQYTWLMIRQIVPLFFTTDIRATLAYYQEKLGFECLGTWQDPPVYAIVARDRQAIHFRCAEPPTPNPGMQPKA